MKKLLLTAAASAVLSTSAMASDSGMYLKLAAGGNWWNKVTAKHAGKDLKIKNSKANASLDLGLGTYLAEGARAELVLSSQFSPELKATSGADSMKAKGTIMAVLAQGYMDVFDMAPAKVFVGAGVGVATVKEKFTGKVAGADFSTTLKQKTNFAYNVGAGVGYEVAEGTKLDVEYKYADFGSAKVPAGTNKVRRAANVIKFGARLDV